MKKYKMPVEISTIATKTIGEIEFDTIEEYHKKAQELWESQEYDRPSVYACNDFEHDEWELRDVCEDEFEFWINE